MAFKLDGDTLKVSAEDLIKDRKRASDKSAEGAGFDCLAD